MGNSNSQDKLQRTAYLIHKVVSVGISDVHAFIENNPIKYSDLLDYVQAFEKMPTEEECKYIGNYGIDAFFTFKNTIL